MAVKWVSALVAAGSLGALATANLMSVPVVVNLVLVALCASSVAVVGWWLADTAVVPISPRQARNRRAPAAD